MRLARWAGSCVIILSLTQSVIAGAPRISDRPIPRAEPEMHSKPVTAPAYPQTDIRPVPRPSPSSTPLRFDQTTHPRATPPTRETLVLAFPIFRSPRPAKRPHDFQRLFREAGAQASGTARDGIICGDPSIKGHVTTPVQGPIAGCGIVDPVRVTSVAGVALSTASMMNCQTARALRRWVEAGAKPAVGQLGGGISGLKVAAHYSCRTRNNRPGARISEHGKGNAIDISAIQLKNGRSLTVLDGWRKPGEAHLLKRMHKAACGPFGTVLGPDADVYHQDHFHFDTADHRSGPYCR
ncbi:MAG: extensin family protein [Pseudomonadota bacterium]